MFDPASGNNIAVLTNTSTSKPISVDHPAMLRFAVALSNPIRPSPRNFMLFIGVSPLNTNRPGFFDKYVILCIKNHKQRFTVTCDIDPVDTIAS
jgi:hypothetical protein